MDNSKAPAIATIIINYFPESDFSANTKSQLALIDFKLEMSRASAIMVLQ